MARVAARWNQSHVHKVMSNHDGNAWVRSAWLAAVSQLDPGALETLLTRKMAGRALEIDISAVVELVELMQRRGASFVESHEFVTAFEAAHGSMANLAFELINARDKAKYRIDVQGLASTSIDGTALLEERRELYRVRKAERSSLFAALNNPESAGSSEHIAKLMEELGVDAIIAEVLNPEDDRLVIRAQPGSGLAELRMYRRQEINTQELLRALIHRPVITMEPSGWGVQVPLVPQRSRNLFRSRSVNIALAPGIAPASESSVPTESNFSQAQINPPAASFTRDDTGAAAESGRSRPESQAARTRDQAAPSGNDHEHSETRSPAVVDGLGDALDPHQAMRHQSEQPEILEHGSGTPTNASSSEVQNPLALQALIDPNSYLSFNANRFGQGKSLVRYSEGTVDLTRFRHQIALSNNPSHTTIGISGDRNDCWLRAAWLSIFTQIDPEVFARSLRDQMASRLQTRSLISDDQLTEEANALEPALTAKIRDERNYLERNRSRFTSHERRLQQTRIDELISEQRTGPHLRWGAALRDLDEDIETVIQMARTVGDTRTFNQAIVHGTGGAVVFRNEEALKNVTYWILKQQSQFLEDSVLTSSVLGNAMGDEDEIAALHQAFSVTSIVYSSTPILDISPRPDSPLLPGSTDLGSSVQNRADNLALAAADNTVVFHAGLHFNAALPNAFFQPVNQLTL